MQFTEVYTKTKSGFCCAILFALSGCNVIREPCGGEGAEVRDAYLNIVNGRADGFHLNGLQDYSMSCPYINGNSQEHMLLAWSEYRLSLWTFPLSSKPWKSELWLLVAPCDTRQDDNKYASIFIITEKANDWSETGRPSFAPIKRIDSLQSAIYRGRRIKENIKIYIHNDGK